jgi:PEP-CTERM motif
VICGIALSGPVWGSRTNRTGSDYGMGINQPPGACTGATTSMFAGVTVTCGFSGNLGGGGTDTLLQFQLTNSSPSFTLNSATLQFAEGSNPLDFGFVVCGDVGDPNSLHSEAPAVPCTANAAWNHVNFSIPTSSSDPLQATPVLSPDGTLVVTFSDFSGLYSGSGITDGVTIYFSDPNMDQSIVSVTGVTTSLSSTPEPRTLGLLALGLAGFCAFPRPRKRNVQE